jgi:hypothetical protein
MFPTANGCVLTLVWAMLGAVPRRNQEHKEEAYAKDRLHEGKPQLGALNSGRRSRSGGALRETAARDHAEGAPICTSSLLTPLL